MDLRKRRASGDGAPAAKNARTKSPDPRLDQETPGGPPNLSKTSEDLKLEIKLRSSSKAARNDPKITLAQREQYQKLLSEGSHGELEAICYLFTAYEAVRNSSSDQDAHASDNQTRTALEVGDSENLSGEDSCGGVVVAPRGTAAPIDTEKRSENDVVVDKEAENSQDDVSDRDGENDQDIEDLDYYDYENDNEDENCSEFDDDFEFKWLEPIDVKVTSTAISDAAGGPQRVAYCHAKLIRRGQMRDDFYGEMEQPSRETSMLAFDLFDRYGRLRSEFQTHPVRKGSGAWGDELNYGDILLIEEIFVDQDHRRQGIGRMMIESLLNLARQKTWSFFAFVWPTFLRLHDLERDWDSLQDDAARDCMAEREHDRAVMFYRSLGFRRVGSTIWFATCLSDDHRSHQLTATEDLSPSKAPPTALHSLLTPFQSIGEPPPSRLDQMLNRHPQEKPDFLSVLHTCIQQKGAGDACWKSRDKEGSTVLHLAASIFNVACVEWILDQDFGPQLLQLRNSKGETPLDLLQFTLEKFRTQKVVNALTVPISDRFRGYGNDAVGCLVLLQGMGSMESLAKSKGPEFLLQTSRGCTCGNCLQGFLSPRMSYALQCVAEVGYDMMNNDIGKCSGPMWVNFHDHRLGYLPLRVLENLKTNKSMRQGFVNLWSYVAACLDAAKVPHEQNLLDVVRDASEWPPATRNFLQRGGTVESVFLAICRQAMERDEWLGDGSHQEVYGEDIAKLPECRNDLEFGFVSGMCGHRRISLTVNKDMRGNTLDENGNRVDSLL